MIPLDKFLDTYTKLNKDNLELLMEIYADDIVFIDPAHKIEGLNNLHQYFKTLYQNVTSIDFSFTSELKKDNEAYVQWEMRFTHPKLKNGKALTVPGITYLRSNTEGKVSYHHDFFDLGSMLYEHIPLLGRIVKGIKRRIGQ